MGEMGEGAKNEMKRERRVYEEATSDEECALIDLATGLVERMKPPEGYIRHKRRGRPRKRKQGHPFEFSWQGMAMVLLLKTYLGLDYRKMASHFKARRELVVRLGFKRAPSKSQIHRCMKLFPERWIKQFNEMVLEEFKKK